MAGVDEGVGLLLDAGVAALLVHEDGDQHRGGGFEAER